MFNFNELNQVQYVKRIVFGVTKYKGKVDDNEIDTCNILIAMPLDVDSGNALGIGVAKVRYGDSTNFDKFKGLTFPCELEVAFTKMTNAGGKSKEVLKDVRIPTTKTKD